MGVSILDMRARHFLDADTERAFLEDFAYNFLRSLTLERIWRKYDDKFKKQIKILILQNACALRQIIAHIHFNT